MMDGQPNFAHAPPAAGHSHHTATDQSRAPAGTAALPVTVRWIPDAEVSVCVGCQLLFDWVRRKHHCRYCGRVYCALCTPQRSLIQEEQILHNPERQYLSVNAHNPQRVCDDCHELLKPVQEELRGTHSNAVMSNSITEAGPQRFLNSPYSFTLREEIRKAAYSVKNFMYDGVIKDQSIPLPLLTKAKGIAFLTVIKVGFVVTARVGTGLVVSRLPNGSWSAPSAIGTAGIGWGAQIGGELTDFVIILNKKRAVDAFCSKGQVNLGAELGIAAGPLGRTAAGSVEASSDLDIAPCYSYSHSKGLFAGISLEGSVILTRPDINRAFYGKAMQATELLGGMEPSPVAAAPLYEALDLAMRSPANGLNRNVRRTSQQESMSMPYAAPAPTPAPMAMPVPVQMAAAAPMPMAAPPPPPAVPMAQPAPENINAMYRDTNGAVTL